jgi:hypothetical protein
MVCSFCHTDKPKPHNVRTCNALDKAIGVYCGKTVAVWTLDGLKDSLVAAGIDLLCTGGAATAANGIRECYQAIEKGHHAVKFRNASRADKAKIVTAFINDDDIDVLLAHL